MTTYTQQQLDIFNWALNGSGHAIIEARAGCGKTTTLMGLAEAIVSADPSATVSIMAYNKAIANEIQGKIEARAEQLNRAAGADPASNMKLGAAMRKNIRAKTLHAAGFGEWRYANKRVTLDDKKMELIVRNMNDPIASTYERNILSLCGIAKSYAAGYLWQLQDRARWYELIDHFDLNSFDESTDRDAVIDICIRALTKSFEMDREIVDFDDMILAPLVHKCRVFPVKWVLIDEAQDLSPARRSLAILLGGRGARMVFVGDSHQAIYGFSGADSDSLNAIRRITHATTFPLNVTWRCPKAIVRMAQEIVPDIEAAPSAPEGSIVSYDALLADPKVPDARVVPDLSPTDAILCRCNAPLVEIAFQLIRRKIPCKMEGRDIGKNLIALIQRWKVKTIDAFLGRLEIWVAKEVAKAQAIGSETKAQAAYDRADTCRVIAEQCRSEGKHDVSDMVRAVNDLFADDVRGMLTLCSVHRSKGREWKRVILIRPDLLPAPWARQDWEKEQEINLRYVAITRSQDTLVFIGEK